MRVLLLMVMVLSGTMVIAQDKVIDSLRHLIETTPTDTIRVEATMDLAWQLMYNEQNEARRLGHQGLLGLKKIKNSRISGYAYTVMGVIYWVGASYDSALLYMDQAVDIYLKREDHRGVAACYINMSLIHQNKSDLPKALEYATKALETGERMENEKLIGSATSTVGNVHYLMENFPKAIEFYKKAATIQASNKEANLHRTYLNIGAGYNSLNEYDSAIKYIDLAIGMAEKIKDYKNLSIANTNMGNLYMDQNNFQKALHYYSKAEAIFRDKFQNDYDFSLLLHSLSKTYLQLGILSKAEQYAVEAIAISEKIDDNKRRSSSYKIYSSVLEEKGQYKEALENYRQSVIFRDSLFNLEKTAQIKEIETKYETSKKEQQIAIQTAELSEKEALIQRNTILIMAMAIIIVLVISLILLVISKNRKKAALLAKENEIKVREAYVKAALQSQETERTRFARDLHDGLGQHLSTLKMNISRLTDEKDLKSRVEVFECSERILTDMHKEIRQITFDLMPEVLIKTGVVEAVRELAGRINQAGKVEVLVHAHGFDLRLEDLHEIALYRIIQEWVNNVLKYAGANRIEIQFVREAQELTLTIEDDGRGFDIDVLKKGQGNGWKNITSRANLVKGEIVIDSHPAYKGTTLILNLTIVPVVTKTSPQTAS